MNTNTVVVRNPSNKLARWMIASIPDAKKDSVLILKGTYPSYLFEIVPPNPDPECFHVEFAGNVHYIKVKIDIDNMGNPPQSYFQEMLQWYSKSKARPTLNRINSYRQKVESKSE
jgi:hypothetical protein